MLQQLTIRIAALSAIATLSLSSAVSAATVYRLDDGESNAAVGLTACSGASHPTGATQPRVLGDLTWLNSFSTRAGGEFIDSIEVVWGARVIDPCTNTLLPDSGLSNEPAKVFLYTDTDQDGQLELLDEEDTIVQPPDPTRPDIFSRIVFDRPQQVSGTFYIAALFPNQKEGQFPAALDIPDPTDPSPRGGNSWLAFSPYSPLAPYSAPSVNPLLKLTQQNAYNVGHWLLRANGSSAPPSKSIPEPTSVMSLIAIAALSVKTLLRRKPKF